LCLQQKFSVVQFTNDELILGRMKLDIESTLGRTYTIITEVEVLNSRCAISEHYPTVMKITFQGPANWVKKPIVEIVPQ
jgi:hypothetical protein